MKIALWSFFDGTKLVICPTELNRVKFFVVRQLAAGCGSFPFPKNFHNMFIAEGLLVDFDPMELSWANDQLCHVIKVQSGTP